MSQWGAYGWAVDHGWSRDQILDHYYGGTVPGGTDPNGDDDGSPAGDGQPAARSASCRTPVGCSGTDRRTPSMRAEWNGLDFDVYASAAATCVRPTSTSARSGARTFTTPNGDNPGAAPTDMLGVCQPERLGRPLPRGDRRRPCPTACGRQPPAHRGLPPRRRAARGRGQLGRRRVGPARRRCRPRPSPPGRTRSPRPTARGPRRATARRARRTAARPRARSVSGHADVSSRTTARDQAIAATAGQIRVWPNGCGRLDRVLGLERTPHGRRRVPRRRRRGGDGTSREPEPLLDPRHRRRQRSPRSTGSVRSRRRRWSRPRRASYRQYDGIWFNDIVLTGSNGGVTRMNAWDFRGAFGLPSPGFTVSVVTRGSTNTSMAFIGDSIGVGVAGIGRQPVPHADRRDVHRCRVRLDRRAAARTRSAAASRAASQVASSVPMNTRPRRRRARLQRQPVADRRRHRRHDVGAERPRHEARGVGEHGRDPPGPGGSSYYAASNAALNAARSRWGNLTVADWNQASATSERSRWFASDGVHLTTTGNAKFSMWLSVHRGGATRRGRFAAEPACRTAGRRRERSPPPTASCHRCRRGASAVALNITAVEPDAAGYMTVWPCDVGDARSRRT